MWRPSGSRNACTKNCYSDGRWRIFATKLFHKALGYQIGDNEKIHVQDPNTVVFNTSHVQLYNPCPQTGFLIPHMRRGPGTGEPFLTTCLPFYFPTECRTLAPSVSPGLSVPFFSHSIPALTVCALPFCGPPCFPPWDPSWSSPLSHTLYPTLSGALFPTATFVVFARASQCPRNWKMVEIEIKKQNNEWKFQ